MESNDSPEPATPPTEMVLPGQAEADAAEQPQAAAAAAADAQPASPSAPPPDASPPPPAIPAAVPTSKPAEKAEGFWDVGKDDGWRKERRLQASSPQKPKLSGRLLCAEIAAAGMAAPSQESRSGGPSRGVSFGGVGDGGGGGGGDGDGDGGGGGSSLAKRGRLKSGDRAKSKRYIHETEDDEQLLLRQWQAAKKRVADARRKFAVEPVDDASEYRHAAREQLAAARTRLGGLEDELRHKSGSRISLLGDAELGLPPQAETSSRAVFVASCGGAREVGGYGGHSAAIFHTRFPEEKMAVEQHSNYFHKSKLVLSPLPVAATTRADQKKGGKKDAKASDDEQAREMLVDAGCERVACSDDGQVLAAGGWGVLQVFGPDYKLRAELRVDDDSFTPISGELAAWMTRSSDSISHGGSSPSGTTTPGGITPGSVRSPLGSVTPMSARTPSASAANASPSSATAAMARRGIERTLSIDVEDDEAFPDRLRISPLAVVREMVGTTSTYKVMVELETRAGKSVRMWDASAAFAHLYDGVDGHWECTVSLDWSSPASQTPEGAVGNWAWKAPVENDRAGNPNLHDGHGPAEMLLSVQLSAAVRGDVFSAVFHGEHRLLAAAMNSRSGIQEVRVYPLNPDGTLLRDEQGMHDSEYLFDEVRESVSRCLLDKEQEQVLELLWGTPHIGLPWLGVGTTSAMSCFMLEATSDENVVEVRYENNPFVVLDSGASDTELCSCAASGDSSMVALGFADKRVELWELSTAKSTLTRTYQFAATPNGLHLQQAAHQGVKDLKDLHIIAACHNGVCYVHNADVFRSHHDDAVEDEQRMFPRVQRYITAAAISPCGERIAIGTADGTIHLYQREWYEEQQEAGDETKIKPAVKWVRQQVNANGHVKSPSHTAVLVRVSRLVWAEADSNRLLAVYDMDRIAPYVNGQWQNSSQIRMWHVESGRHAFGGLPRPTKFKKVALPLANLSKANSYGVDGGERMLATCAVMTADGMSLVIGCQDGSIYIVDLNQAEPDLTKLRYEEYNDDDTSGDNTPGGYEQQTCGVTCIACNFFDQQYHGDSADIRWYGFVVGYEDGTVRMWSSVQLPFRNSYSSRVKPGSIVISDESKRGLEAPVQSIGLSSNGRIMAVGWLNQVHVFDLERVNYKLARERLARIVIGGDDRRVNSVALCEISKGESKARVFPTAGHLPANTEIRLVTSDDTGTLRIWVPEAGQVEDECQNPSDRWKLNHTRKARHAVSLDGHGTALTLLPRNRILLCDIADQGMQHPPIGDATTLLQSAENRSLYAETLLAPFKSYLGVPLMRLAIDGADVNLLQAVGSALGGTFKLEEEDLHPGFVPQEFDALEYCVRLEQARRPILEAQQLRREKALLLASTKKMVWMLLKFTGEVGPHDRKDSTAPRLLHDLVALIESEEYRELAIEYLAKYGLVKADKRHVQGQATTMRMLLSESRYALCDTCKPTKHGKETLWEAEKKKPGFEDHSAIETPVNALVVSFAGALKPGEHGEDDLIEALRQAFESAPGKFAEVLDLPAVKAIIDLRWSENAYPRFKIEFVIFVFLLVVWTSLVFMIVRLQTPDAATIPFVQMIMCMPCVMLECRLIMSFAEWHPRSKNVVRSLLENYPNVNSVAQVIFVWLMLLGCFMLFWLQYWIIDLAPQLGAFFRLSVMLGVAPLALFFAMSIVFDPASVKTDKGQVLFARGPKSIALNSVGLAASAAALSALGSPAIFPPMCAFGLVVWIKFVMTLMHHYSFVGQVLFCKVVTLALGGWAYQLLASDTATQRNSETAASIGVSTEFPGTMNMFFGEMPGGDVQRGQRAIITALVGMMAMIVFRQVTHEVRELYVAGMRDYSLAMRKKLRKHSAMADEERDFLGEGMDGAERLIGGLVGGALGGTKGLIGASMGASTRLIGTTLGGAEKLGAGKVMALASSGLKGGNKLLEGTLHGTKALTGESMKLLSKGTDGLEDAAGILSPELQEAGAALLALKDRKTWDALRFGVGPYLKNGWNLIDIASYTCVLLTILGLISGGALHRTHLLAAITTVLLWVRVLQFLSGNASTAWLVRVLTTVMADMRSFIMVVAALLLAFTTAFMLLFAASPERRKTENELEVYYAFGNELRSLVTTFGMMFYASDASIFEQAYYRIFAYSLFFVYTAGQAIVLLNLLVAIMSDSYEKVQERARIEGRTLFVKTMLENEGDLDKLILHNGTISDEPENVWIHLLQPTEPEEEGWSGVVMATYKRIKTELVPMQQRLASLEDTLEKQSATAEENQKRIEGLLQQLLKQSG